MPNQFDHHTVQQYGGVAWAKSQVSELDPQAIQSQIDGYRQVSTSLNQIVDTLNTANASIQASWSGDAATAAAQTFTDTSNHAQNVVTTVGNTITQLQNAKTVAATAKSAMAKVPDEKPLPAGGLLTSVSNTFSDVFTGTDPTQQAQQHNLAARTQAADVLNSLSNGYDTAAANLSSISGKNFDSGFTPSTTPSSGSFNLGAGSYGGSEGSVSYTNPPGGGGSVRKFSTGGGGTVANGVFTEPKPTSLAGVSAPSTTETAPQPVSSLPGPGGHAPLEPILGGVGAVGEPIDTLGTGGSVSGEGEILSEGGAAGEGSGTTRKGTKSGSSNVFGEEGFGSEEGLAAEQGSGFGRDSGLVGGEGQAQSGLGQAMSGGGRGGGPGSAEEELGSSKYSRGRYFGGDEPGSGAAEWTQPVIGGDESLLKSGQQGTATGRVSSVYEGATDAHGKPLHMMRAGGGRLTGDQDEEEERGQRPAYLKEDPQWWQAAQQVLPPVVE